jgi:hypothetical protein
MSSILFKDLDSFLKEPTNLKFNKQSRKVLFCELDEYKVFFYFKLGSKFS